MLLESFAGKRYYLVEVIAFVLCHLKDQLMIHLGGIGTTFLPSDFDWVITVPAIWKARGKQMMREAAYLVRSQLSYNTCMHYVLVRPCLQGIYREYTKQYFDTPEGEARGCIKILLSVFTTKSRQ